jgi:hypothetical protein
MFSVTDTTFDLLILQLIFHTSHFRLLLFRILPPIHAGFENDVLANGRGVYRRTSFIFCREAEFRPRLALSNARVHNFFDDGGTDAAGCFNFLAILIETVSDYRLCTILVGCNLLRRKLGGGIVELFIVGPVWAAAQMIRKEIK